VLLLGGEAVETVDVDQWESHVRHRIISYGPTEASVISSAFVGVNPQTNPRNIGRPFNAKYWIVSTADHNKLVPIGASGELLIEGPILARGYLSAQLTAQAFVENPHWTKSVSTLASNSITDAIPLSRRFYKTGDVVYNDSDGNVIYLNRKDSQVKLRGQRIELGEVEYHILRLLPNIRTVRAHVIQQDSEDRQAQLVAFVVLRDTTASDAAHEYLVTDAKTKADVARAVAEIESHLMTVLPRYMVPSLFLPLRQLPSTTSLKTDLKRLTSIVRGLSMEEIGSYKHTEERDHKPLSPDELKMRDLWATVLQIDVQMLSSNDTFFAVGGDSVMAIRLAAACRTSGLSLSVSQIFQAPRLSDMAAMIVSATKTLMEDHITPFSLIDEGTAHDLCAQCAAQCNLPTGMIDDIYPCTPMQEAVIAASLKTPGAYIARFVFNLPNDVDLSRFQLAVEAVVAATPILRTRIFQDDSQTSFQAVLQSASIDWKHSSDPETAKGGLAPASSVLGAPMAQYDLVTRGSNSDCQFIWTMHHALYDGWSMALMRERIDQYYRALSTPPDNQPHFNRFVKYLSGIDYEATAQFWKTYLLNAARPTFPAVKIGHDVRASEIVGHKFLLESQDPSPRITLPTILYAAWGLLVQCYSASSDVTFGATLSGRDISLETVDEIVGPTMSTVPVRITIGETAEKVSDLLHAVQKGVTGLEEYQHYGISNIRRVSKDAQLACQFQSHIVVQPVDKNIGEVCSTWSDSVGDLNRFNSYALMIQCSFRELSNKCREVSLSASYDPVVLDHTHIRRILHQFAHISNNLIGADESTLISNIDLVSSEDREDLDRWNNPNRLNPQSLCIHDIFTRNACQTPDSLAVSSWDGDLTYRELENLSNSLCAYLVNKGVKRGDHLALCFERSKWMSIASLATLKAGAIMVPLDHKHPKLRLEAIITQVKAEIVLTCESLHGLLTSSAQTIVVDAEALEWTQWSEVNGPSVNCAEPQDTAVVLFTSGSTGVPKGFILDHKALCSSTLAFGKAMFMDASTRVFHFASHSFDAVVTEILVPLFFGGCTCVPTEKERLSKTAEAMQRMKINWAFLTPSVARLIDPTEVPTLKTLVLGGEACSSADIGQWHKHVEHLVNGYGPGECSVFSSAQIDMKPGSDPTNIGSTFNAHYWITRPNNINQLCPIGAIGELLIDGPILARGYLNSPEQTAGAFVEPPSWYNATPRSKLYRTGDLARYNLDGSVSYIGRLDNQVKLRGQRIELTDVEIHLLRAMPDLTTAVVEMIDVGGDDSRKRLVAFLRLTAECQHDEGLLIYGQSDSQISRQLAIATEILQRILPAYMVPSHCLLFKSFPLTRSGKTDRRELRKYATEINADQLIPFTSTLSTTRKVASSSEEILLQKHWAVVIGLSDEEIGVDDHFFYLGGDSIQAMHLVARLRKQNISLTVMDVFRNPLLQDMARTLTASSSSTIDRPMEPLCFWEDKEMRPDLTKEASRRCDIAETLIEDIYPTTQLQEGLMVLSIKQPGSYIARFVMNLSDTRIDVERFIAAWEETFLRMPILRTRIYDSDLCGSVQVVTKEHIRWLKSNDLNAYIKQDRASSMCLGSSLSRFALIRNGEEQHCVLTVHHALYDAWSFRLIVRNVNQLYAGSIPSPVGQFNKYVSHLHYSDSKALKEMQEFWRSQLDDARVPDFPSSSPIANDVQDVQASSACEMTFDLPIHRPRSCTVSTLIYAAWSLVISRYTGTSDVVFGAVMSGRFAPIPGIEEIGGPTINTIPLRHNIDFSRTVDQYLEAFQTQVTSIIPFQTHGLQQIQRITESTSEACRFRTLLTVQPLAAIEKNDEISIHPIRDECSFTAYPLAVDCSFSETKLIIEMAYDSRLIEEPQLMRIMHQLNHAILQLCSDGSRKLSTLELASLQDMRELDEWNSHDVTLSQTYIHDVLTTSALLHPHKQAIDSWDGKLTYEDLDHQSTQLANYLSNVGVGPEIMVPLCFERSMWFVVALFAVSKAGGVFVPLDPSTPIPRMKNIIDQSGSTMILCSSTCRDKFKSLCREIICVDSDSHWRQHSSSSKLTPYDSPQQAAYVIFTSGSTGNPKGCVVTHEAFCSQLVKITENHFDSNMRTLQFASYSFDGCLLEIIPTIAVSGCLCIPSDANRLDNIAEVISRMDASWAFLTPSMARILEPTGVPTLRNLLLGGEALAKEDVSRWVAHVELAQVYGPTEGVVICSRVLKMTENLHPNNIGKAYHANFWIVKSSDHDFLVPIGAVGELLIDSPVLARGYLHDEEKTAVSFIEGPAWIPRGRGPRRMYKTGDLVRYASDGSIIFVGRKDDQIKLRGIRIQLDEITYHLRCAFPAVSDVVVIKSEMQGRETLIAFLSLPQDPSERSIQDTASDLDKNSLNVNEATRHQIEEMVASATKTLLTTMPQQMIPSVFIPIQSIPSTVAGKQDRGRLRRLLANLTASEFDFYKVKASEARVQPSTPMESKLRSLWSSILRIDSNKISVRDSFFTLGGDSILAIKLVAACRTEGIILSAVDIFRTPSLSDMALTAKSADIGPTFDIPQFSLLGGPAIAQAAILQAVKECGVEQYSIADIYPCTSLQEGLIAISLKKPGAYMAYGSLELPRETDVALFKAAWDLTFKAYPILRTRIIQSVTNGFLQVVIDEPLRWQCGDSLRDYLDKDREHHMSLGTELSRYAMVQDKSTGNSHFVWTIHHALYDGWSMSKILQHVDAVYRKSGPVTPPMDFKQYIAYTTRRGNGRAAESYWRSTLQGSTPSAFPHSTSAAFHRQPNSGLRHVINLTSHQSVTKGFTTATIIRAAWALLVSRYTDSLDVVFGAILAGRTAPVRCIEDIGGPTISTVPIRIIVDPAISVDEYLVRVQDQATNMIPHEAFGVQNISKISAEAHAVCQFQNLLIVQPNSLGDKDTICPIRLEASGKIFNNLSSYTLAMHCSITDAGIEIDAGYDSCVISEKQMKRVLRQFELLITQLRDANALMQVSALEMVTADDHLELQGWFGRPIECATQCLDQMFEESVKSYGDRCAIDAWDGAFTYKELDDAANRLAQHLIEVGVVLETKIPLCFQKSRWAIVAMLAVAKAGGTFVPLDPAHPRSRLELIIDKIEAEVALCSADQADWLSTKVRQVITVDAEVQKLRSPGSDYSHLANLSSSLYIVFTSGSTGEPKGCVIEHRALCSTVQQHGKQGVFHPLMRTLQLASYSFGAGLVEILSTLIHGGCVCVVPNEARADIVRVMRQYDVSFMFLTPTFARLLPPQALPTLKTIILGSEPLTAADIEKWSPHVNLVQGYGQTECASIAAYYPGLTNDVNPKNVGHGMGARFWIVDPSNHHALAPLGAIGELLIEGPILARGYLNDVVKTDAAFIAPPEWRRKLAFDLYPRLYKTGDLASFHDDGSLLIFGRKDTQVKLRGQRVELGEVEYHLRRLLPTLRDIVVEVVEPSGVDGQSHAALVAFICLGEEMMPNGDLSAKDPRVRDLLLPLLTNTAEQLAEVLPAYMTVSAYLPVAAFPMTATGKIDRKRLRQQASSITVEDLKFYTLAEITRRKPTTSLEVRLQNLWATVLGTEKDLIGIDDNFFQLGGDSIIAIKLSSACRSANLNLPVVEIFKNPTLLKMAIVVQPFTTDVPNYTKLSSVMDLAEEDLIRDLVDRGIVKDGTGIEDVLSTTYMQNLFVGCGHMEPKSKVNYISLDFKAAIDAERLENACRIAVKQHAILRTVFVPHQRQLLQIVLQSFPGKIEHFKCDSDFESCASRIIESDNSTRISFGQTFVQFLLFDGGSHGFRFTMRISHAQFDGMSLPIILNDIAELYRDPNYITTSPGFPNFIYGAHAMHDSKAVDFYRNLLKDANMTDLCDRSKPASYTKTVNRIVIRRVPYVSYPSQGITFASLLKAAWSMVLAEVTGKQDIVFGYLVNGRNAPLKNIETIAGPCINIIPVRLRMECDKALELLRQVHDQGLASMPFETFSFDRIVGSCTDWPRWTRCSTVVQCHHESIIQGATTFSGQDCRLTANDPPSDLADLVVDAMPDVDHEKEMKIAFHSNDDNIPSDMIDRMADLLSANIQLLGKDLETALPSVASSTIQWISNPKEQHKEQRTKVSPKGSGQVQTTVREVWAKSLSTTWDHVFDASEPFYDLWPGPTAAVYLSERYRQAGLSIGLDEVFEHPSMSEQSQMLFE
jgi:amino acid adenylation domain-containing protein